MRQINAGLFISLDGVVEAPEKWTGPYFNDQVGQAVGALMATNDAMLLGRLTYEGFAAAFGGQSGGMADQMNNTPKYVVSSTLTSADWQNSTLINGDVAARISELKQQPGRNIGMSGSSALVELAAAARPARPAGPARLPGRAGQRQAPVQRAGRAGAAARWPARSRSAPASCT